MSMDAPGGRPDPIDAHGDKPTSVPTVNPTDILLFTYPKPHTHPYRSQ